MRYFKNKGLLAIITLYVLVTIYFTIKDASIYVNTINPIFWGFVLAYLIWDIKKGYVRFSINKKYLI